MIYLGDGMYSNSGPDNYLMHYGVLGMRWGIRKAKIKQGITRYYDKKSDMLATTNIYKKAIRRSNDRSSRNDLKRRYKKYKKSYRRDNPYDKYYDRYVKPIFEREEQAYFTNPKDFKNRYPTVNDISNMVEFGNHSIYDTYKNSKKQYKDVYDFIK